MKKLIICGAIFLVLTSCQKYPNNEITEIRNSLDSAKVENAYISYYEELISINDSVDAILVKIEEERSKFIGRKFNKYKTQLQNLNKEVNRLRNSAKNEENEKEISLIETETEDMD